MSNTGLGYRHWQYSKDRTWIHPRRVQKGKTMATLPDLAEQIHEGLANALEELETCFPETCTENIEELLPLITELRERL